MIFVVIRDRGIGQTLCSFEHVSCLQSSDNSLTLLSDTKIIFKSCCSQKRFHSRSSQKNAFVALGEVTRLLQTGQLAA